MLMAEFIYDIKYKGIDNDTNFLKSVERAIEKTKKSDYFSIIRGHDIVGYESYYKVRFNDERVVFLGLKTNPGRVNETQKVSAHFIGTEKMIIRARSELADLVEGLQFY
jgi:hypothetical protein